MRVITVYKTGGDFAARHVQALHAAIARNLPGAESVCLTDVPSIPGVRTEPLRFGWPGWWSKMELFAPWHDGATLFMDLDTVLVGDLHDIATVGRLTVMRDVYRPGGLQSSIMFIPEAERAAVWDDWIRDPWRIMDHQKHGDQGFLERHWLDKADRWQDVLPGQVVSYKADVRKTEMPPNARVVVFHGKPRPWHLPPSDPVYQLARY